MENNMRWGTKCVCVCVCVCVLSLSVSVFIHLLCVYVCVCAYLAATVCANACLSMGVSVWPASRLLAIMSSAVVVRGILVIAGVPGASSPRCITDRRVTQPKRQGLLDWHSNLGGIPHRDIRLEWSAPDAADPSRPLPCETLHLI